MRKERGARPAVRRGSVHPGLRLAQGRAQGRVQGRVQGQAQGRLEQGGVRRRRLSSFVIRSQMRIRPTRIRRNTDPNHECDENVASVHASFTAVL